MFRQSQAVVVFSASSFHSWKAFKASLISWEETSTGNASKHHWHEALLRPYILGGRKIASQRWGFWSVSFTCTTGAGNQISNSVICWPSTRDILRVLRLLRNCQNETLAKGRDTPWAEKTYWTSKAEWQSNAHQSNHVWASDDRIWHLKVLMCQQPSPSWSHHSEANTSNFQIIRASWNSLTISESLPRVWYLSNLPWLLWWRINIHLVCRHVHWQVLTTHDRVEQIHGDHGSKAVK